MSAAWAINDTFGSRLIVDPAAGTQCEVISGDGLVGSSVETALQASFYIVD